MEHHPSNVYRLVLLELLERQQAIDIAINNQTQRRIAELRALMPWLTDELFNSL